MSTSRQDYIARVRYTNDLPPPPCPPKLINTSKIHDPNSIDSSHILSSFFRREGFKNLLTLDNDLGMDMNLLKIPGSLEKNNLDNLGKLTPEFGNGANLHPDDAILLTDPSLTISSKNDSVSFLRRTQYISSDEGININVQTDSMKKKLLANKKNEDEIDIKADLKTVEDMFDAAMATDGKEDLKHPTKRLKAKRVWNFLPDTSMLDQKFYDIKFAGSASIIKERNKKSNDIHSTKDSRYLSSMFREVKFNDQSWVSLYTTSEKNADEVKEQLDEQTENAPITEEEAENPDPATVNTYLYKKAKDFEGEFKDYSDSEYFRHLAISFNRESETAMYIPISGRVELKKRRIDPYLEPRIKERTYDQIYLSIREPTQREIYNRDILRGNFDPMDFGTEEQYEGEEQGASEETEAKEE